VTWRVEVEPPAAKQLANLDRPIRQRVAAAIDRLAENPKPQGCRLVVTESVWRIRVGDYRIKYVVEDDRLIVVVVEVVHRSKAY
jgi:mRNA interferase RelE/StbE